MKHTRITRFFALLLSLALLVSFPACGEKVKEPYENIGGSKTLSLEQTQDAIILENGLVRLVLNRDTGSIRELANKQSGLYLTKNARESIPVRLVTPSSTTTNYESFSYTLQDGSGEKQVQLSWDFGERGQVQAVASLAEDSQRIIFRIKLLGTKLSAPVVAVEYPIMEGITTLKDKASDRFLSPFVTGYLFSNPVDNFNDEFYGISRAMGEYPSGWGYPMQFSAYYSQDQGGFYWQTTDDGDTVKSFTLTGDDGKLRLGIYHYLNELSDGDKDFDYDIVFENMIQGNWYEAANRYRDWAQQQSWATRTGLLKDRTDVDKTLYEDTTLTIFGYRVTDNWEDYADIYDLLKGTVDGKFLNIAIYKNNTYMDKIAQYEDLLNIFEFSSLRLMSTAEDHCDYYSTAMLSASGEKETFTIHYYECAAEPVWRQYALSREQGFITNYGVDGFYYDVDIAADHPKLCYDLTHTHGTRVNVLQDFYDQILEARALSETQIPYTTGTEMITEQLLPYVNYYQARANGGLLGWMEHDRVRVLIENGSALQLPLFDYVYHENGILRTDGYLSAESSFGDGFYYAAAYTALNGGIPELNYEYYPVPDLPKTEDMNLSYLSFLNALGQARTGYGKDFLVYGKMMPAPQVQIGTTEYEFHTLNYTPYTCVGMDTLSGKAELPDAVVTAWQNGEENALFLCNTSREPVTLTFTLEAGRDFGIEEGAVTQYTPDGSVQIASIRKGAAKITVTLAPQQLAMLNF